PFSLAATRAIPIKAPYGAVWGFLCLGAPMHHKRIQTRPCPRMAQTTGTRNVPDHRTIAHLRAIPVYPSLPTRFQLVPLIIPHPLNRAILAVRVVWSFSFVKCMAPTCVVFFLSQFFFFQTFSRKFKLGGKDQTRVDVWRSE